MAMQETIVFEASYKGSKAVLEEDTAGGYLFTARNSVSEETKTVSVTEAHELLWAFQESKYRVSENHEAIKKLNESYSSNSPGLKPFITTGNKQGDTLAVYYLTLGGCNFYKETPASSIQNIAPSIIASELQDAFADDSVIVKAKNQTIVNEFQDYVNHYQNHDAQVHWAEVCGNFVDKDYYKQYTEAYESAHKTVQDMERSYIKDMDRDL